jgi:hypothetical protein
MMVSCPRRNVVWIPVCTGMTRQKQGGRSCGTCLANLISLSNLFRQLPLGHNPRHTGILNNVKHALHERPLARVAITIIKLKVIFWQNSKLISIFCQSEMGLAVDVSCSEIVR